MKLWLSSIFALLFLQGNSPASAVEPAAGARLYRQESSNQNPESPSVEIRKTADGHIVAVVKNHPDFQNTFFVLKTLQPAQFSGPIRIDNINITFSGECVAFQSRTTPSALVLRLPSAACPIQPSRITTAFEGYGLIRQIDTHIYPGLLDAPGTTYPPVSELVKCDCFENSIPDKGQCDGGGQGASDCSYSESVAVGGVTVTASCTVKCGNGYYACCYDQ